MVFLGGCNERLDDRTTDQKQNAPQPDLKTRYYMACPKCGCPQRPYQINELKSYYRCSGNPPKFPYHTEHLYQHTLNQDPKKGTTEF
jgi:hypothetical protein